MTPKTPTDLKNLTVKELLVLAKKWDIPGIHDKRKDDLAQAIAQKIRNAERRKSAAEKRLQESGATTTSRPVSKPASPVVVQSVVPTVSQTPVAATATPVNPFAKTFVSDSDEDIAPKPAALSPEDIRRISEENTLEKDLSVTFHGKPPAQQDRVVLILRDQYWLQAHWEITPRSIERAKVSLGPHWHGAVPTLRLFRYVAEGQSSPRRELERHIRIHGGVQNWYIDVRTPPARFQIEIGYLSRSFAGQFFAITASNAIETPPTPVVDQFDSLDGYWSAHGNPYSAMRNSVNSK